MNIIVLFCGHVLFLCLGFGEAFDHCCYAGLGLEVTIAKKVLPHPQVIKGK
jgi:hypothetical protein